MEFLKSVSNYFNKKAELLQRYENLRIEYINLGIQLFNILNKFNPSYLGKYIDFSELCNNFGSCSLRHYVFSLKLLREPMPEEVTCLTRHISRCLASCYGMSIQDFVKRCDVSVVGGDLVITIK